MSYVITELSIRMFPNSPRVDLEETAAIENRRKADRRVARCVKYLVNPERLEDARKIAASARKVFYELTLPFGQAYVTSEQGARELEGFMRTSREEFVRAAREFADHYSEIKAEAKKMLGTLYDEQLYPSNPLNLFAFEFSVLPPYASPVESGSLNAFQRQALRAIQARRHAATYELYNRLLQPIQHLVEVCQNGRVMRDAVVNNIRRAAEIARTLCFDADEQRNIERLAAQIEQSLDGISPEQIRVSNTTQRAVTHSMESVAASLVQLRSNVERKLTEYRRTIE